MSVLSGYRFQCLVGLIGDLTKVKMQSLKLGASCGIAIFKCASLLNIMYKGYVHYAYTLQHTMQYVLHYMYIMARYTQRKPNVHGTTGGLMLD